MAPPGHHYERVRRRGLLITGLATFGGGYLLSLLYGGSQAAQPYCSSSSYAGWGNALYGVPLVGPLMRQLVEITGPSKYTYAGFQPVDWLMTVVFTAAQGVGFTPALLGLRTTDELVPDESAARGPQGGVRWSIAPLGPIGTLGLTVSVRH